MTASCKGPIASLSELAWIKCHSSVTLGNHTTIAANLKFKAQKRLKYRDLVPFNQSGMLESMMGRKQLIE